MLTRDRVFALLLLFLTACGGSLQLNSRWRDREIIIDGADADWDEGRYILEKVPISIGIMNDVDHLYLTMVTADRSLQTLVAMRGLELWLDPKGAKRHVFGLHLPGAMRPGRHGEVPYGADSAWDSDGITDAAGRGVRGRGRRSGPMDRRMDPRQLEAQFERMQNSRIFVLASPGDEGVETSAGVADAIQVSLTYDRGRLVYEARLPLQYLGEPTYTIAATGDTRVGIGLTIPAMRSGADGMLAGRGGMGRGSASSGRGMGGPGDMVGGREDGGPSSGFVFEQWTRVNMAAGP